MFSQFDDEDVAIYFERLNAPLKKVPPEARAEMHQELRQHLDALAAAHEELGATPEEAKAAALRQFGDPAKIGRRLFQEWEATCRPPLPANKRTLLWACGVYLLTYFGFGALVVQGEWFLHWQRSTLLNQNVMFGVWYGLAPFVAGVVAAFWFPSRAVRSSRAAGWVWATLWLCWNVVLAGQWPKSFWFYGANAVLGCVLWPSLGGLGARIGGKARELMHKRRVAS